MSTNKDSTTMAAVESDEHEQPCDVPDNRFPTSNCCRDFHNALAVIMDMLDVERSAAADREKRLISHIDQLSRTVQELSRSSALNIPSSGSSAITVGDSQAQSKSQRKRRHATNCPTVESETNPNTVVDLQLTSSSPAQQDAAATCHIPVGSGPTVPGHDLSDLDHHQRVGVTSNVQTASNSNSKTKTNIQTSANAASAVSEANLPDVDDDSEDAAWRLVTARKPVKKSVVFVGNLLRDASPEQLARFVECRSSELKTPPIKILDCKVFQKQKSSSARLVVHASCSKTLLDRRFWPRPLYSRQWNFDKYSASDVSDDTTETTACDDTQANSASLSEVDTNVHAPSVSDGSEINHAC